MTTRPRYVIGIDGGTRTGFAVYDRDAQQLVAVETTDFAGALGRVEAFNPADVLVVVEDPAKIRAVYAKHLKGVHANAARMKVAQNVGAVKRESTLLIDILRSKGYTVDAVAPNGRKWTADYFAQITGWTKRCSEHARDAARFCFMR